MNPILYKDFYKEELENEISLPQTDDNYSGVHGGKHGIGRDKEELRRVDNNHKMKLFNSKKKDIQTYSESEGREIGKNTCPAIDHATYDTSNHMNVKGVDEAEAYIKRCVARGAIHSIMNHLGIEPKK